MEIDLGRHMKKSDSCPLDGSWSQDFCVDHHTRLQDGTLPNCQHRADCIHLRDKLESNSNESMAVSKEILVTRIPKIFTEPDEF